MTRIGSVFIWLANTQISIDGSLAQAGVTGYHAGSISGFIPKRRFWLDALIGIGELPGDSVQAASSMVRLAVTGHEGVSPARMSLCE
jgi:hypothetical protein